MDSDQVLFRLFGKFCPEGTILSTEGSPGQELYVIQSGAVRFGAARERERPPTLLGPGDLLGEEAFFGQAARKGRAEVVRDARLIQINDRTLGAVVRHAPRTAQRILEQLLASAAGVRGELDLWTAGRLLPRLAPYLTTSTAGGIVPAQLAEHTGLAETDVLPVLEELRRRGCLVLEGSAYRAPDAGLLQREIDGFAAPGGRA